MSAAGVSPATAATSTGRRWTGLVLKGGLSVAILAVLAARTDVSKVLALVTSVSVWAGLTVLALVVTQTLLTSYRWMLVMAGVGISIRFIPATQALFASLFINQCVPSYVGGDAYRVYWLHREGHRLAAALRGIAIDRVSALIALVAMMVVTLPRLFTRFPDHALRTAMATVAVGGVVGAVAFFACDVVPQRWRGVRAIAELAEMSAAARRILIGTRTAIAIGPLAILVHAISAFIMYFLARDLALPLEFLDCLLLVPPVMLLSAVPVSISGWGVREGVMVGTLAMIGINADHALALSVLIGLVTLANSLFGIWPLTLGDRRYVPPPE